MHRLFWTLAIVTLTFAGLYAQKTESVAMSRPVIGNYSLEIGHSSTLITYLSPLTYSGNVYSAAGYWSKAMPFNPESAIMEFKADASYHSMLNPAHTAKMIGLYGDFTWGMAWRKKLAAQIQVTAGGAAQIAGGAFYLVRNSNNPVQAIVNASLDLTASISRPFKIGKLPILVADRIQIPSLSVFFCPQYGETYYEIYLGNHKGLAHAGWWGNNFRIDNLLSVTLDFGRTAMSLGYRINAYTQWANNLNTKIIVNSFCIGVVPGGLGLKQKTKILPEETIYSIY